MPSAEHRRARTRWGPILVLLVCASCGYIVVDAGTGSTGVAGTESESQTSASATQGDSESDTGTSSTGTGTSAATTTGVEFPCSDFPRPQCLMQPGCEWNDNAQTPMCIPANVGEACAMLGQSACENVSLCAWDAEAGACVEA